MKRVFPVVLMIVLICSTAYAGWIDRICERYPTARICRTYQAPDPQPAPEPAPDPQPDPQPAPEPTPSEYKTVIFVHGLYGSSYGWTTAKNYLISKGWPAEKLIARNMTQNNVLCSTDQAKLVGQWVEEFGPHVALVGHSRGGSNIMEGLWEGYINPDLVDVVVTLAGFNRGCTTNIPNDETPGDILYSVYFGTDDTLVRYNMTHVEGAYEEEFSGVTHYNIISDRDVLEALYQSLIGNRGAN